MEKHTHETKQALLEELIAFYWRILDDGDLKPADRIASAKRLEALITPSEEEPTPVKVVLNLPQGTKAL